MSGSVLISSGAAGAFPVSYGYYPHEGSRCVSAAYNWTAQASFTEDMGQLVARGVETTIQTVFIDNSGNAQSVTLTANGTGQVITCPASSQGFFPFLLTGIPGFTIATPATIAATTKCFFVNVPIAACVWHV